MSQSTICPKCDSTYSQQNPPKMLINCPHTLCRKCLLTEILCPIDHKRIERRKYTLEKFNTHQQILVKCVAQQHISNQQRGTLSQYISINVYTKQNTSNISQLKNTQNEQAHKRTQIIQKIEECKNQNTEQPLEIVKLKKVKSEESIQYQNCLLHSKSAQLICMDDMCFICPSCALFGEHKNHKIQSFETFVLSFGNLAQQCLIIKQQMNEKEEKLNIQKLEEEIQQQIKKQKNIQLQKIKNNVNNIIKILRQEETKMLKNLEETYVAKKNKLMNLIHSNQIYSKIRDYERVVQTLSEGINHLLKMENIQKYVEFVDENNSKSYSAKQGEYLLLQIDNNYKTIKKNITNQIIKIKVEILQKKSQILKDHIIIKDIDKQIQAQIEEFKDSRKLSEKRKRQANKGRVIKMEIKDQKTPILNKNNEQQMLINSADRSKETNINNNSLSPITPVGSFQYVMESRFSAQPAGKIQMYQNSVEISQINLHSGNLYNRSTIGGQNCKMSALSTTKRQDKRENQSSSLARTNNFSKNKSINSSNQTQKQYLNILTDRNEVKKKKKIDLPQKYLKIYDELQKDNLDLLDLGGAFLGDNLIFKISEIIPTRNKLKTVKFMNNKITDDIFPQLLIRCTNVNTLNLSYNNLTQKSLDFIEQQVERLGHLSNITLSNNKIVLRNVKDRLQMLKRKGVKISL